MSARNLLVRRFFPSNEPVVLATHADTVIAEYLVVEGALILADAAKRVNIYKFPSLLVRNFLLTVVTPLVGHPIPQTAAPINNDNIDLVECVIGALPALSKSLISSSSRFAFKQAWVPSSNLSRNTPVPQEAVYHFEHYAVLRAWLPADVMLLPESSLVTHEQLAKNTEAAKASQAAKCAKDVKCTKQHTKRWEGADTTHADNTDTTDSTDSTDATDGTDSTNESLEAAAQQKVEANWKRSLSAQSCDLTLICGSKKYIIEYGATLAVGDIHKHFQQAVNYAKIQGATEALFVHFTLVNTNTPNVFVLPKPDIVDGVHLRVLHIVHNAEFTHVQVLRDGEWHIVNI